MTVPTTAIIGYGCFGKALGSLLAQEDASFRAFDPHQPPPPDIAATSFEQAIEGADVVVVSVPVPEFKRVMEQLAPCLDGTQLVLDVGSVKVRPVAIMQDILGATYPWVGTHPLFGPSSLAVGELPLRVVVCPNLDQPDATARAIQFYESIDCLVLQQDAESHDRAMADCHALTYFVAKGLMDAGVNLGSPFAPPSSRAIARTVREVRSDAGHLFGILHRENPFAPDARARLMEALSALDRRLSVMERDGSSDASQAMTIPSLDERSPELKEARANIDELDEELLRLLAQRMGNAHRARDAKAELGHGVLDSEREAQLIEQRRGRAKDLGLDPDSVEDVFQAILRFSRRAQRQD